MPDLAQFSLGPRKIEALTERTFKARMTMYEMEQERKD